ncbi:MAG: hypothetical protein AAGJ94_17810 [Pseudomonadota bacterium]
MIPKRPGNKPLLCAGAAAGEARCALIMLHGRRGAQERLLSVAQRVAPPDVAIYVPSPPEVAWWPQPARIHVPAEDPHLAASLAYLDTIVQSAVDAGIPTTRIVIAGLSQGACLALEYAALGRQQYRAVFALSGALLGTMARKAPVVATAGKPLTRRQAAKLRQQPAVIKPAKTRYNAGLFGQTIRISVHSQDPHIPVPSVEESSALLAALGADVTVEIEPGRGHGLIQTDIARLRDALMERPADTAKPAPEGEPARATASLPSTRATNSTNWRLRAGKREDRPAQRRDRPKKRDKRVGKKRAERLNG